MIPTIETERLRMRAFTTSDAQPMLDIMSGEDVLRFFPLGAPLTLERVTKKIQSHVDHWSERNYGIWALETKAGADLVGSCGLQFLANAGMPEIDFLLGRDTWGKGYATESATAAIRWGFKVYGFHAIAGLAHVDNAASLHVLQKLGMRLKDKAEWFGMPCEYYEIERSVVDG